MLKKPVYILDEELNKQSDKIPNCKGRSIRVHSLINSLGILKEFDVIPSKMATVEDLTSFHSVDYIEFIKKVADSADAEKYEDVEEEYGLGYDCPIVENMLEFMQTIAGGSLTAAKAMLNGAPVAINWCGGWHHAQRDEASGYCYVNDIVIAILKLRQQFDRVLYVDLDAHHGDGVENAFSFSQKIMTVSVHRSGIGFFPGTGHETDVGIGNAKGYACNLTLKDMASDKLFHHLVTSALDSVVLFFNPHCIVVQCGADGLVGDPCQSLNLTPRTFVQCIQHVLRYNRPTLLLGGGGYNFANTSRCWSLITGLVAGLEISEDIPEHPFFTDYGPDFTFNVTPSLQNDHNCMEEVAAMLERLKARLCNLS